MQPAVTSPFPPRARPPTILRVSPPRPHAGGRASSSSSPPAKTPVEGDGPSWSPRVPSRRKRTPIRRRLRIRRTRRARGTVAALYEKEEPACIHDLSDPRARLTTRFCHGRLVRLCKRFDLEGCLRSINKRQGDGAVVLTPGTMSTTNPARYTSFVELFSFYTFQRRNGNGGGRTDRSLTNASEAAILL